MDIRKIFFRYRSYTPIPIALLLLYQSDTTMPAFIAGFCIAVVGEGIRIRSNQYAGGATRTRKVGAKSLCTSGPYAHVRNPLYIANILIYLGILISAGGEWIAWLGPLSLLYFGVQYAMIISLEEETLQSKFGDEYSRYVAAVPRLLPALKPWRGGTARTPMPFSKVLFNERRTIQNFLLIFVLILFRNTVF